MKEQRSESRSASQLESRCVSRIGTFSGDSSEELGFEMGITKTTEVIISREGSVWDEPKSTGLESWKEEP